jgi:adenylate cyclase
VTEPSHAVFLSYASQDAWAAQKICEALRAAGIEVWFDQSELRGGDVWDRRIQEQIHSCRLFIPIISANTEARDEGYFRREWALAVDRTRDMAERRAFLLPVVIDGTPERGASVPEKFHEVQWTRLRGGETTPELITRIASLVSQPSVAVAHTSTRPLINPALPQRFRTGRSWVLALLILLVVATSGVWLVWRQRSPVASPVPAMAEEKSLAVLPFIDMSEKHDQEYFSDGLSEELIDRLAHSPDLKVIARTSSFAFKGKNEDVRTIAARLGVANLLEGSVRKSDNMLRITAQLIRARDGAHIWSQSFDRSVANIFQIQEEIAATVATALQTALSARGTSANPDIPPEAYNAFLRGKYFRQRGAKDDSQRSVDAFKDAIRLEPNYALAWVELGRTFNAMGLGRELTPAEAYKRASDAVRRALQINPGLAEAHQLLSALLWNYQFDFRQSRAELSRALELDPHLDVGGNAVVDALAFGRTADAVREARRVIDRDPLTADNYGALAWALYQDSRFEEAETAERKALELNPIGEGYHSVLAGIALARNEPTTALELLGHETDEASKQAVTINALWMLGRRDESNSMLRVFEQRYGDAHAVTIASSYVLRGNLDAAFRWLDRAYQNREPYLTLIRGEWDFRKLHDDPRYNALIRKLDLPE